MNSLGVIDPHLQAIVRAAENGATLQRLVVVCGSTVYVGIPTSTANFSDTNVGAFAAEIVKDVGGWKTPRQEKEKIAGQQAIDLMEAISPGDTLPSTEVLSLCPAQVFPSGMTSYEVPAVRVHLHRVDSWWVAPFLEHQAKFRSGSVGVSF
jgi:hypothetical protein